MTRQLILSVAVAAVALAAGGCGAANTVSGAVDPVARAADVTGRAPGYHLSSTLRVTTAGVNVNGTMSGVIDTVHHTGALTMHESLAGHTLVMAERLAGTTIYMSTPKQPALLRLTGGKPWLKMDLTRALGTLGFGALPTQSTNPAQFLDYLRAVSAKTTRVGSATIGGVQTTHYDAVINLDRYPQLFPPSGRAGAAQGIAHLEKIIGSHPCRWTSGSTPTSWSGA